MTLLLFLTSDLYCINKDETELNYFIYEVLFTVVSRSKKWVTGTVVIKQNDMFF